MSSAPSSRLTSCAQSICAAFAVPTMRGSVKRRARHRTINKQRQKCVRVHFHPKKAILVPFARPSHLLAALPTCSRSIRVNGFRHKAILCCLTNSHGDRALAFLKGLLQLATLSSLGVVSRSLRLLAVLSGDEPEANVWHRILVWCCHRGVGGHICGARLRAIDDGR